MEPKQPIGGCFGNLGAVLARKREPSFKAH